MLPLLLFLFLFLRDDLLLRWCGAAAAHHDGHGGVSPPYACSFRSCRSRLGHLLVAVVVEFASIFFFFNFLLTKKKKVYFSVPGGASTRWYSTG